MEEKSWKRMRRLVNKWSKDGREENRTGPYMRREEQEKIVEYMEKIIEEKKRREKIMRKLTNQARRKEILYRGITMAPRMLKRYMKEGKVEHVSKRLQSWTTDKETAKTYAGTRGNGVRVIYESKNNSTKRAKYVHLQKLFKKLKMGNNRNIETLVNRPVIEANYKKMRVERNGMETIVYVPVKFIRSHNNKIEPNNEEMTVIQRILRSLYRK
jgi:hypothetical protein